MTRQNEGISSHYVYAISMSSRYGGIRRSSASSRTTCDGTSSTSVWPSPRQTPGPPCPCPSGRPPSDHRPARRHARHAHILQIGLHLTIAQADARPVIGNLAQSNIRITVDVKGTIFKRCSYTGGMVINTADGHTIHVYTTRFRKRLT